MPGSLAVFNHPILLILSLGFGALAGCSGGGGNGNPMDAARRDAPPGPGQGIVEIGSGTVVFESLADEDELVVYAGPQGGHHFIVHARIQELEPGDWQDPSLPENPRTNFTAYDELGQQIDLMVPPYALGYRDLEDGWHYLPSGRFLRLTEAYVEGILNRRVRIRVDITDASGKTATDERWIRAIPESDMVDAGVPDAPPANAM